MTDIVFLDTETLGLDHDAPVWEFAAIASDSVDLDQPAGSVAAQLHDQEAVRSRLGGIGLTTLYELWGTAEKPGPLGSVYIGKRRFSSEAQIADFIHRLESAS